MEWTLLYLYIDMIYYNYGGLRLFTLHLPLGGATLFVVTSVDKVNAQSVNENRRLRRDKSL